MTEPTTNGVVPAVKATQVHKAFGSLHVLKGVDMTVMPGSPAMSVTEPGTMPPPSMRLNSVKPVLILEMFSVPISVMGFAVEAGTVCDCVRDVRPGAAVRFEAAGRAS